MNYLNRFILIPFLALIAMVSLSGPASAQNRLAKEQVMAALLYNFARFVTWPESSFPNQDSPLVIAIQGKGLIQQEIAKLHGKQIEDRTIIVNRLAENHLPTRRQPCHVLYIPQSNMSRCSGILKTVARRPILTLSDMEDFTSKGGILHLEGDQNVRFSINLDSAEQAGLIISSKLFRLARMVIKNGQVREGP